MWLWLCSGLCSARGRRRHAGIYSQQCFPCYVISDWPHFTRKTNRQLPGPSGPRKWGPFYSPHCKFRSECAASRRATRQEDRASAAYFPVWLFWLPAEVQRHYALHRRRLTWLEAWRGTATVLNAGLWWTQIVGGGRSQRGGRFQHRSRFQHTRESSLPRLQHNMERSLATRHAASTCQPSGLINSDHAAFAGTRRRCLGAHYCCPQAQGRSLSTISWRRCWAGLGRSSISTTCTISE